MSATTATTTSSEHQHHQWCDTAECFLGHDEDGDYASHYGHNASPTINASDCHPWRNEPEGEPEIRVRPIRFTGSKTGCVEINCGDTRTKQSTSGSVGVSWLTPSEARELTDILRATADAAESQVSWG